MVIHYLDGLEIPDTDFDTKTPEEIKAWIESQHPEATAWVCPMLDGHISFGAKPDWRELHG